MLRRPPSWISLTEEEIQLHLQRIFLRTLPDLGRLRLDDRDETDGEKPVDPSSESSASDDPGEPGEGHDRSSARAPARESSCLGHPSSVSTHTTAQPASISSASTQHQTGLGNGSGPATTPLEPLAHSHLASHPKELTGTDPPRDARKTEIRQQQRGVKADPRQSHQNRRKPTMRPSRLSTGQISRSSLMSGPSTTISRVPPQTLALASTGSCEATSTQAKASPGITVDPVWKPGAILESESISEHPRAD